MNYRFTRRGTEGAAEKKVHILSNLMAMYRKTRHWSNLRLLHLLFKIENLL